MVKKINDIIINMTVTNEEVKYLEASAKNQSDSLVWHQQHVGQITSSSIHAIAHASIDNPVTSLIKKMSYMSTNQSKVSSLSWDCDKEQPALLAYFNTSSDPDFIGDSLCINPLVNLHTDFEIQESRLMLKQNEPWFSASPDSFVCYSCCGKGIIEVKCPLALKDDGLQNAINNGTFHIKKKNGVFELEKAHCYYYQVQHEMYVCNLPCCDFVVWTHK